MSVLHKPFFLTAVFVSLVVCDAMFIASPVLAAVYQPGETLNPACAPSDLDCGVATSTVDVGSATGVLPTDHGGTGLSSLTANELLISNVAGTGITQVSSTTLHIASSGAIGIGTSSPAAKLHISGDILQSLRTDSLTFVSETKGPTPGTSLDQAKGVFVSGKYAYIATNERNSLAVVDISIPSAPVFLGETRGGPTFALAGASDVFVSGKYAYVANSGRDSLAVIDVSNPSAPTYVAETRGPVVNTSLNGAWDVFVSGKYAYVVNNLNDSLAVIDVSNPAVPTFISEVASTTLDAPKGVFVSGKYAYVANFSSDSLAVIDISNPEAPTIVGETRGPTPGTSLDGATEVFVSGKYAYVANFNRDSLAVIDISSSTAPTFVSEVQSTSLDGAASLFVSGKYAYVANSVHDSVAVIDISNPAAPTLIAETHGPVSGTSLNGAWGIYVSGGYAYVASQHADSLAVIDLGGSDLASLSVGTIDAGSVNVANFLRADQVNAASSLFVGDGGILSSGGLSLSGSMYQGLQANSLTFIAETQGPTPGTSLQGATDIFVTGRYAYVVNTTRRSLVVMDISNPAAPTYVGEFRDTTLLNSVSGIHVAGRYAYVSTFGRHSLAVIDISNPAAPTFVAETQGPTPGTSLQTALSVFVSGRYAYVTTLLRDSLVVIDISNPAAPTYVGETRGPTPGTSLNSPNDVFVSGKYAYVANGSQASLAVVDISNPAAPTFVAETRGPTPGTSLLGANSVFVSGRYAYVTADQRQSLAVIDISSSTAPTFVAETRGPIPGTSLLNVSSVRVAGKYAYVANADRDSLAAIDISNPAIPTFVSEARGPIPGTSLDGANDLAIVGRYAYVVNQNRHSLAVIDIGGSELASLSVGAIDAGSVNISNLLSANQINAGTGLYVGDGGILSSGALSISGTTTVSYFQGRVGIGTSSPSAKLTVSGHVEGGTAGQTILQTIGSDDYFLMNSIQNLSGAVGASSDWVAIANNGDAFRHYIDMGINGSGGGIAPFTAPNAAYMYSVEDTLHIGALGTSSSVTFYAGGGIDTPTARMHIASSTGDVGIGTTTPGFRLHVVATTTNIAKFEGANSTGCAISAGGIISCTSDKTLKDVTGEMDGGDSLAAVLALKPSTFTWKGDENGEVQYGFIAQEVEDVLPGLVITDTTTGLKSVSMLGMVPYIVSAMQEQYGSLQGLQFASSTDDTLLFATTESLTELEANDDTSSFDAVAYLRERVEAGIRIARTLTTEKLVAVKGYFKRVFANELCLTNDDGEVVCITGNALEALSGAVVHTRGDGAAEPKENIPPTQEEGHDEEQVVTGDTDEQGGSFEENNDDTDTGGEGANEDIATDVEPSEENPTQESVEAPDEEGVDADEDAETEDEVLEDETLTDNTGEADVVADGSVESSGVVDSSEGGGQVTEAELQ